MDNGLYPIYTDRGDVSITTAAPQQGGSNLNGKLVHIGNLFSEMAADQRIRENASAHASDSIIKKAFQHVDRKCESFQLAASFLERATPALTPRRCILLIVLVWVASCSIAIGLLVGCSVKIALLIYGIPAFLINVVVTIALSIKRRRAMDEEKDALGNQAMFPQTLASLSHPDQFWADPKNYVAVVIHHHLTQDYDEDVWMPPNTHALHILRKWYETSEETSVLVSFLRRAVEQHNSELDGPIEDYMGMVVLNLGVYFEERIYRMNSVHQNTPNDKRDRLMALVFSSAV